MNVILKCNFNFKVENKLKIYLTQLRWIKCKFKEMEQVKF